MLANLSLFPIGKGESLSREVSALIALIDKSGIDYRLTSMGTILEGDWDEVMSLVKKLRNHLLKRANRVYLSLSIDDRRSGKGRIRSKVATVEKILGKTLRK